MTATAEVSQQTDEIKIKTTDAAVQASSDDQPEVIFRHAHQLVFPFPPPHLSDEVCPDHVIDAAAVQAELRPQHSPPPHIPQVDGLVDSPVIADQGHIWSCKCCMFEKFFDTEDELQHHHNGLDDRGLQHFIRYDECNICYPWHVWS